MVRLHARACQITAEIITLMKNGFADGAMARWRTLYEVGVVATVIADAGESLAKCYIQHEVIESKLAMDEYARCHVALGYKPIPHRERRRVERAFAAAVKAHGADFGKPYGWAAAHLKKKRVTFRDLEDAAQQSGMRSYYKMASYNVHADTPKSIFCRLGVIGDQSIVIAGATDAGFTEPAQNAAITLIQITGLLLADRASNLDVMTKLRALTMIRDEIPDSFMRTERKLKRDHARLSTMNQSKSGSEEGEGAASPSHLIDARIKELGDWRGETLARVRSLIKEAAPEVVEEWKWRGVPVWSHAGIICTGETYKNAVKMTFAKSASLEDPSRLVNAPASKATPGAPSICMRATLLMTRR